jgi:hypothetical protein
LLELRWVPLSEAVSATLADSYCLVPASKLAIVFNEDCLVDKSKKEEGYRSRAEGLETQDENEILEGDGE